MESTPAVANEGSALGRMFNVLPTPGEVFEEIKERPVNHWNWLVPAFIWMVVGGALVLLMFSMESFKYEMKKQQEKALQQQVEKGKMTQAQVDQIEQNMPPWVMEIAKIFAVIATAIYAFGIPFIWGTVAWLLCVNVYKTDIEYMKAVEAVGLASAVYILGVVVGGLLSIALGKMTFVSPAFFIKEFDMSNRNHMIVAALNPFYLWYVGVVAVSISVLAKVSVVRPLVWCLGIWALFRVLALSNRYTMNFVL
jgi:hypothetical protein